MGSKKLASHSYGLMSAKLQNSGRHIPLDWYFNWVQTLALLFLNIPMALGFQNFASESFFHHDGGVRASNFYDFCYFLCRNGTLGGWKVSQPSLFFCGERFGRLYLPPGGLGRSSESFFHHDSGVRANHFCDFCNFLRPNGTLGGW